MKTITVKIIQKRRHTVTQYHFAESRKRNAVATKCNGRNMENEAIAVF